MTRPGRRVLRECAPGSNGTVPLEIVQAGSAVLRAVARALTREEILSAEIAALIESMRETMHAAPGVGLAAPQIGAPLRLAVIEDKPEYIERLTPVQAMERDRRVVLRITPDQAGPTASG